MTKLSNADSKLFKEKAFWPIYQNRITLKGLVVSENALKALCCKKPGRVAIHRVARCPVFDRTVRYFGSLSGIKMKVIPDNACVRYFQSLGILHFSYNL